MGARGAQSHLEAFKRAAGGRAAGGRAAAAHLGLGAACSLQVGVTPPIDGDWKRRWLDSGGS